MKIKTFITTVLVLLASLPVCAGDTEDGHWLVITLRDGTVEAHPFSSLPTITIDGTLFKAKSSTNAVTLTATDIDRFRLTDHYEGDTGPEIAGDVNGDGAVDVADIATVISVMASAVEGPVPANTRADVNGDGTVDVADIATVITIMASSE